MHMCIQHNPNLLPYKHTSKDRSGMHSAVHTKYMQCMFIKHSIGYTYMFMDIHTSMYMLSWIWLYTYFLH